MQILALLVILLFGAGIFFLLAYLLRNRFRKATRALWITGTAISLFLFGLWLVEAGGWQKEALYKQVQYGLQDTTLQAFVRRQADSREQALFMMSLASTGLRQSAEQTPEERTLVSEQLSWMAAYAADDRLFEVWRNRSEWGQQAFFLAHATIILSHYQAVTLDEQYSDLIIRSSKFLAAGITRSRYKHLASRPGDAALRPQDNATALYALRLYDAYYGENIAVEAIEDWTYYIERELQYDDTTLPCAGFTATNRCRLASVGGSLAILSAYSTAADLPIAKDFWREFRHYYKETFLNVLANIQITANGADRPDFCDFSVAPLNCDGFQHVMAQYAAANRGDWITYYQLNNSFILDDLLNPPNQIWSQPPKNQILGLIKLSARLCAASTPR